MPTITLIFTRASFTLINIPQNSTETHYLAIDIAKRLVLILNSPKYYKCASSSHMQSIQTYHNLL